MKKGKLDGDIGVLEVVTGECWFKGGGIIKEEGRERGELKRFCDSIELEGITGSIRGKLDCSEMWLLVLFGDKRGELLSMSDTVADKTGNAGGRGITDPVITAIAAAFL